MDDILMQPQLIAAARSVDFMVEVVPSLVQVPVEEFRPLVLGRSFYVSRPWLLTIERIRAKDTAYVLCRDRHGHLLVICPVYWGDTGNRGFYDPFWRFLDASSCRFKAEDWLPTAIIGSRAGYTCEFLVDRTLDNDTARSALALTLRTATSEANRLSARSVSAIYVNECGRKQLHEVLSSGHDLFIAGANAVIDVCWTSFDDYLLSLGRQRREVRRELRIFDAAGYGTVSGRISEWIEPVAGLMANLERKYGHQSFAEGEARELRIMAEAADEDSRVFILLRGDLPVGAVVLFVWEGTVYVRSAGFDYEHIGKGFEYFNLVIYQCIRFAINEGYRRIEFGVTAHRAKMLRGARLEPLWCLVATLSGRTPFQDPAFLGWNRRRMEAIAAGDPTSVEGAGLV